MAKNAVRTKRFVSVQDKFQMQREDMASSLVERDEEIDVVLTALICQEHPLLVGPPGTAKSLLLDTLMSWLGDGGSKFNCLLTKYSVPEEMFGPISVQGLKADVYRRITTNKLPEADFAFVDEIFKASSSILNTMLRILNERVFENGDGSFAKCPLLICVAASNEWPGEDGGKELGALFDRFLFRKTVQQISKAGRRRLLWTRDHRPKLRTSITVEEIQLAHEEAMNLAWEDDAKLAFEDIIDQLNASGIFPGDRRMFKAVSAAQAYAYLNGADSVQREHLEILSHVLWADPVEQPDTCAKIVRKVANPLGARIMDKLAQARDVIEKSTPTEAVPKLQAILAELKELEAHPKIDAARKWIAAEIKQAYNKVIGAE